MKSKKTKAKPFAAYVVTVACTMDDDIQGVFATEKEALAVYEKSIQDYRDDKLETRSTPIYFDVSRWSGDRGEQLHSVDVDELPATEAA